MSHVSRVSETASRQQGVYGYTTVLLQAEVFNVASLSSKCRHLPRSLALPKRDSSVALVVGMLFINH